MEYLHGDLVHVDGLAGKFEDFATEELGRWSPAPPLVGDMIELADRFGLSELGEELSVAAARADDEGDRVRDERKDLRAERTTTQVTTDADLSAMFARLGDLPAATDQESV